PAHLRRVARAGRGATPGRGRLEDVGGAVVGDPVAAFRHVAGARRRPAHRRALRVRRTGGTGPRAGLRDVARPGRWAAHRARVARWVLARIAAAVALIERARSDERRAGRA